MKFYSSTRLKVRYSSNGFRRSFYKRHLSSECVGVCAPNLLFQNMKYISNERKTETAWFCPSRCNFSAKNNKIISSNDADSRS